MVTKLSCVKNSFPDRIKFLYETVPDKELFIFYDGYRREAFTAKDVYTLAGRFASRLRQHGFKRHGVIANTLPNCPERVITDVGIILAGCVTLNGQVLLADGSDFFPSATVSKCKGVIVAPGVQSSAWSLLEQFVEVEISSEFSRFCKEDLPDLTSAILICRENTGAKTPFLKSLRTCDDDIVVAEIDPGDTVVVFTTSGSTGYSKLVPRSSSDLLELANYSALVASSLGPADQPYSRAQLHYSDRMLGWIGGFPFNTYCNGVTRVLLDSFYNDGVIDPAVIVNAIIAEACPQFVVLPLEFEHIARYLESQEPSWTRLGAILTGGQPLSKSVISNMLKFADKVGVAYGSTEAGYISWSVVEDADHFKSYNCGKGPSYVRIRVVRDDGELCQAGEVGTIHVQSPLNFRGYFNRLEDTDPQTQKSFTPDGWLNTDDNGYLNENGDIHVLGRKNDVISYGASTLYPGWLEEKIMECPDVEQACVVPVSDPILYQTICACLKPAKGSDLTISKIKKHCEAMFVKHTHQGLAPVPDAFLILRDDFPETLSGKPDRRKLKEMAEKAYGVKA